MTIDFEKMDGLVPAIIQDADTRQVLMLGFMNQEAFEKTEKTGKVTFWSRTRQCLWTKGETSGNFLNVVDIKVDCDNDTLLIKVHPDGPTCHTGTTTSLFKKGVNRIAQKVGEEALETVIEATNGTSEKLVYEASDLLYHLIVLLTSKGLRIEDAVEELHRRHDPNWDAERRKAKAEGKMK